MGTMKWMTLALGIAVATGCDARLDTAEQDSAAAALAPARAVVNLSDLAGLWTVRVMSADGDTTLTTYQLRATGEPFGWAVRYRERPPIRLRVTVDADSLIYQTPPYESVLRPGVRVRVSGASRLVDGRLVGTFTSRYEVTTPDSVYHGRTEGTRHP